MKKANPPRHQIPATRHSALGPFLLAFKMADAKGRRQTVLKPLFQIDINK